MDRCRLPSPRESRPKVEISAEYGKCASSLRSSCPSLNLAERGLLARSTLLSVFAIAFCCAAASAAPSVVHANAVFPVPAPTAAISDWVAAQGRTTISLESDKATLRGWVYPSSKAGAPTALIFGGNGYSIDSDSVDGLLRALAAQGATVVEYDYRGFGFSSGTPDVVGIRSDALRLYDKTVEGNGGKPVIVFGYSLGTLFASYVASQRAVQGLVLVAPIANADEEFRFVPPGPPGTYVLADDTVTTLNVDAMIRQSRAPLLVVHGTADKTIAFAEGKEVFAASPASKKVFVPVKGAGHELLGNPKTIAAFRSFLRSLGGA